jgi:hypothetical protein
MTSIIVKEYQISYEELVELSKEIRAVVKNPREKAQIVTIEDSLESLQKCVGGDIEWVGGIFPHPIGLYANEEGKLIGLEPNIVLPSGDYVAGSIVVVSTDKEGNTIGLEGDVAYRVALILDACGIYFGTGGF